ncbi:MAG: cytochrome b N-terminal domain-containing protein [Gemmatimonadota bacterium]
MTAGEGVATPEGSDVGPVRERLALEALEYPVPREVGRMGYMLGGVTAFLILLLLLTGVYLAQFYDPSPAGAHDSVLYLITRAPLGDWIRSVHYWSAAGAALTITLHLAYVFWRRAYRRPREVTWWAGVGLAGLLFLLIVTGTALRYDQEGYEALAHFVAGGQMTGSFGAFFTDAFTRSTSLLSRIFSMHTSLLPLTLLALIGLHFWLIRHLGLSPRGPKDAVFRDHAIRLAGIALLAAAVVGLLAVLLPENLGYPAVPGAEVTKPFWPVLWVYGLENLLGGWGMVLGPAVVFGFLLAVPLLDRGPATGPSSRGGRWVRGLGLTVGLAVLALWMYGVFGAARQHIGM